MAAKQVEVLHWLKEVLEDSEVPPFQKNESNIDKLHQLMTAYKEASHDVSKVKDYLESTCDAYENNCKLQAKNFEELGVTSSFLNGEEQNCLEELGSLYYALNLQSSSTANMMLAINFVEDENSKINIELLKEKKFTENLIKLSKNIAENIDELKRISADAEKEGNHQKQEFIKDKERCDFNEQKIVKYKEDLKVLETKLKRVGFREEISLESISKKVDEVSKLQKEFEEKKQTLDSYNLPPDMALAEVKVEEARQILDHAIKNSVHNYNSKQ